MILSIEEINLLVENSEERLDKLIKIRINFKVLIYYFVLTKFG